MSEQWGKYEIRAGVLIVDTLDVSFLQATWAIYQQGEHGEEQLIDGGTLKLKFQDENEARQAALEHAKIVAKALAQ